MGLPEKNTGAGYHFLLHGIFLTHRSNPGLLCFLHCRWILYQLSHQGSPDKNIAQGSTAGLKTPLNYQEAHIQQFLYNSQSVSQSVQSLSCVRLFATLWIAACQASLSTSNSWSLLKLVSIELAMPSNHLILCHPLLLLPPIPPSIRVFSNESTLCMRWPKYWSFSFSISPSNEYPGLISFRMDWLDLLEVQGTLKNLLQHHCSKASIFWCSAFFTVQLSHPYLITGKTVALTRQ